MLARSCRLATRFGCRGLGFRVEGVGFRVYGFGFRVEGFGLRAFFVRAVRAMQLRALAPSRNCLTPE